MSRTEINVLLFRPAGHPPKQGDLEGLGLLIIMNWHTASPDRYNLLKAFAKENRKYMTEAESALWKYLKGNGLGHKFLRQHIIGDYIVDFLCRDKLLVIEVDGGYHSERTQQEDDAVRQQWLESIGYKVIRFSNEEILVDIKTTIDTIIKYLRDPQVLPLGRGNEGV